MTKEITRQQEYWECDRCGINSRTRNRMCPCPRGGCEAEFTGVVTITTKTELVKFKNHERIHTLQESDAVESEGI